MSAPYTSSENRTKHSDRAAAGQTRLTKSGQGPPDTVIKLPDGRTIALPRSNQDFVQPKFRKYNPRRVQPVKQQPPTQKRGTPFQAPWTIPFNRLLLGAFVLHQVVSVARALWRRFRPPPPGELVERHDSEDEWDEEHLDPEVLAAERRLRAELLPAMLRQAMPRVPRNNLAKRAAEASRNRGRKFMTAKQMMRPAANLKQRPPGMLERMSKAVQQQAQQLAAAQSQEQAALHQKAMAALQARQLQQLQGPQQTQLLEGSRQPASASSQGSGPAAAPSGVSSVEDLTAASSYASSSADSSSSGVAGAAGSGARQDVGSSKPRDPAFIKKR